MKFLVTYKENGLNCAFFTDYFDAENHFNSHIDMIVYDLVSGEFTTDGKTWITIDIDHL